MSIDPQCPFPDALPMRDGTFLVFDYPTTPDGGLFREAGETMALLWGDWWRLQADGTWRLAKEKR